MKQNRNRRAVFIDRDGTLIEMVYDKTHGIFDSARIPDQVRLKEGAPEFIIACKEMGYLIVVVSNQPGIAKGTLSIDGLHDVNANLIKQLDQFGASVDIFRYCPHHPQGGENTISEYIKECGCRKPAPGMLLEVADECDIELTTSWMVGDGIVDIQAGNAAGCKTILITKLKIEQIECFFSMLNSMPDFVAADLRAGRQLIVGTETADI